jgi:hypothetical protein
MNAIQQTNARTWRAVAAVRVYRCTDSLTELRTALQQRRFQRTATITEAERRNIRLRYVMQHAPDLIRFS